MNSAHQELNTRRSLFRILFSAEEPRNKYNASFLFSCFEGKKAKKLYFPPKLCHFFHICLFFVQKEGFCLLPYMPDFQCRMSKSYSELLILSSIQYT